MLYTTHSAISSGLTMAGTTTLGLPQPNINFFPGLSCCLKSFKPITASPTLAYFPTSKLVLSSAFVLTKGLSHSRRKLTYLGSNTMFELIKTSSFRNGNGGEEGIKTIEQEALVGGSSGLLSNGFESTLNRLSKWIVSGIFAAVLLGRHDAEAVWFAMGSIVNALLSVALKRILNQERPASALKSDPGMPSSHAQSIFFNFMFVNFSVVEWLGINDITLAISGFILILGSYLTWLRVSQRLHTLSQVVVGAIIGTIFSVFWYWSWNAFLLQAFESSLWVQIIVLLVAAGLCLGFVFYVFQYWFRDEQ
ncbi:lipid phosphate phosphatase epsilon 2, chloroplastic [Humulus lupulus]|uniref:lipid phosphate phosphatase epsilon 2, chloroplastic n=1 Tax=Humulus lupulus TaxID=3486 RepID=UPI002B40DE11|nr:lipid phosphate phosphatase epsilon 2, chloroplastic [Humulus lupulus]